MAPTVKPRRSTRNKTVPEAAVKKATKVTKPTPAFKKATATKTTATTKKASTAKKPSTKKATTKTPFPKDQTVAHYAFLNVKDDTFTHPLAAKSTSGSKKSVPTDDNVAHGVSQPALAKKMFPYLCPPLEPDYEPKWQPMWGTWPTAPKAGPKACTSDKYYFFSFLGDAPRAQRALESLCRRLEESGFGGDVEKANKPLFDARNVLREWTEWRDSIPPDEYSY